MAYLYCNHTVIFRENNGFGRISLRVTSSIKKGYRWTLRMLQKQPQCEYCSQSSICSVLISKCLFFFSLQYLQGASLDIMLPSFGEVLIQQLSSPNCAFHLTHVTECNGKYRDISMVMQGTFPNFFTSSCNSWCQLCLLTVLFEFLVV